MCFLTMKNSPVRFEILSLMFTDYQLLGKTNPVYSIIFTMQYIFFFIGTFGLIVFETIPKVIFEKKTYGSTINLPVPNESKCQQVVMSSFVYE